MRANDAKEISEIIKRAKASAMAVSDTDHATFEEAVRAEAARVAELVIAKQRDYGKNNILTFGELGVVIRLNDKVQRLANLLQNGETPRNESLADSWDDVIGYGLIGRMLQRGTFELPMGEEVSE